MGPCGGVYYKDSFGTFVASSWALEEVSKIHCNDSGMEAERSAAKLVKNGTQKNLSKLFQKVFLLFPASREGGRDYVTANSVCLSPAMNAAHIMH